MTHPAPAQPNSRRMVESREVLDRAARIFSVGADAARLIINRTNSLGEAMSVLDQARVLVRSWEFNKANDGN